MRDVERGGVTSEDRAEMTRRLEQEALLYAHNFEPVLPDGRELWARDHELFTRRRAVVEALRDATEPIRRER